MTVDDFVGADVNVRPAASLKRRVFRAGGWTLVGHFLSLFLRLISSVILTRIFSPDTFGLLAIITAISTIIGLLTDLGLRQSIIRSPNGDKLSFLNTAWTVQVLRGLVVWGLCVIVAGALHVAAMFELLPSDSVYAQPRLPALIVVASFSSVILGFQSMKLITASRDLNLQRVTLIGFVSQLFTLIAIILLGLLTRSIWSYVAGLALAAALTVVLSQQWLRGPRDRFAWDGPALNELKHFGKWIFLSSAIGAAILQGDRILMAGWFTPTVLGFYSIATNLVGAADALANSLFGSVAMPTLSEVNRLQPERFPALFSRIRWLSDTVLLLAAGFLFASGKTIVALLYDSRYSDAGWMLQWLSFGLVFVRYNLASSAFIALGHPNYVTINNVVRSISLFAFLGAFYYAFGIDGAVIGIAFHMIPSTFCMLYFKHRLGIGSFRLEAFVLLAWPIGWLIGAGFDRAVGLAKVFLAS